MKRWIACLLSAMISHAIVTALSNPITATASMAVILGHEFGHYYAASARGADPDPPVFLSLGAITIGMTEMDLEHLSPRSRRYVLKAGAAGGIGTVVALAPAVILTALTRRTVAGLLVQELLNATVGPDGQRRRQG